MIEFCMKETEDKMMADKYDTIFEILTWMSTYLLDGSN